MTIGNHGTKRDFFDLYFIMQREGFTPHRLAEDLYAKYGFNRDFSYIGMGLNYFDDAEEDKLPYTFVPYDWDEIKKYFSSIQPEFMQALYAAGQYE